jgi:hypothetical protein
MAIMPTCPICGSNELVTSDGGLKQTVATVGGTGAGIWAGTAAGAAVGTAGVAATTVAVTALAVVALPVVAVGLPILGWFLGRKLGDSLEDDGAVRTYFCQRDGHRWTAAPIK